MKIGFIGFGNMAQAIVGGLIRAKAADPRDIYVSAHDFEKLKANAAKYSVNPCETNAQVAENSEMIFLAVKPYQIAEVAGEIIDKLKNKPVISIAAGMPYEKLEGILGKEVRYLSAIPNTPIAVGKGIIICEKKMSLTTGEFEAFSKLMEPIAIVEMVETKDLGIAGTIAGCGPAFAAMFIEALADAGVMYGLKRDQAYRLASGMVSGSGELQLSSGDHPGIMKDKVCSPGGTTIRGVASLEQTGFRGAVISAIKAIQESRS